MKTLLTKILPLLLPVVIYFIWLRYSRRKSLATGADMPGLREAPWIWMIAAALGVLVLGVIFLQLTTGEEPGGVYVPPHVEDGRVVPGHIER